MKRLLLERGYTDLGTLGTLYMIDECGKVEWTCVTVELPWKQNQRSVSCIPEGTYTLKKRASPMVKRTSKDEFEEGWEVTDVPNRTFIMVHVANYPSNVEGCIGVGKTQSNLPGGWGVSSSQIVFRDFMARMEVQEEWQLTIKLDTSRGRL